MTFTSVGSACAPGILDRRPALVPRAGSFKTAETDFLRLLARIRTSLGTPLDFHHVAGRLRLRAGALKQDTAKLDAIRAELDALPGVRSATANRLTGSIVVDYDVSVLHPDTVSTALAECRSETGPASVSPWADHIGDKLVEWVLEKLAVALIAAVV